MGLEDVRSQRIPHPEGDIIGSGFHLSCSSPGKGQKAKAPGKADGSDAMEMNISGRPVPAFGIHVDLNPFTRHPMAQIDQIPLCAPFFAGEIPNGCSEPEFAHKIDEYRE
jgi:hypothetical protein